MGRLPREAGRPERLRRRPPPPRGVGRALGLLLAINILPLAAAGVLVFLHFQGKVDLGGIQPGFWSNVAVVGACAVVLTLVCSWSLPAAHGQVCAFERGMAHVRDRLLGRAPGSRALGLLALPFLFAVWLLAWLVRACLLVLALALLGVAAVFCARLFDPGFLQEWVDRVVAYRP